MTRVDDRSIFLVARGEQPLLDELRRLLGDYGWVQVIEDRRRQGGLLPREGRGGRPYLGPDAPLSAVLSTSRRK